MDAQGGGGASTKPQIHTADIKCDNLSDNELKLLTAKDRRWKQEATSPRITFNSTGRHSGQPASGVPEGVGEHMAHSRERQTQRHSMCKRGQKSYIPNYSFCLSFIHYYLLLDTEVSAGVTGWKTGVFVLQKLLLREGD